MSEPAALSELSAARATPRFRAVSSDGRRYALRLEEAYWEALGDMAAAAGASLGGMVASIAAAHPDARNLSSLVRVACIEWLGQRRAVLETIAGKPTLNALVNASPGPLFALSRERKVVAYNAAFLNMIQSEFANVDADIMQKGLRLSLDHPVENILERLVERPEQPLRSGFVLGIADRRMRRDLNIVRAPLADAQIIMGYVLPR